MKKVFIAKITLIVMICSHTAFGAVDFTRHTIDEVFVNPSEISLGDVDNDGDLDVLGAGWNLWGNGTFVWWENFGSAEMLIRHDITNDPMLLQGFTGAGSIQAGDLNNDGQVELVSTMVFNSDPFLPDTSNLVIWTKNTVNHSFDTVENVATFPVISSHEGYSRIGDMDANGYEDIIYFQSSEYIYTTLGIYLNNGTGSFSYNALFEEMISSELTFQSLCVDDLDGDGDQDILCATILFGLDLWRNDGAMSFTKIELNPGIGVDKVLVRDLDDDGDADILCGGAQQIVWLENDGTQQFAPHGLYSGGYDISCLQTGDLDGDFDTDIIVCNGSAELLWMENDGQENFSEHAIYQGYGPVKSLGITLDADNDGDVDILQTTEDWFYSVLRNWENIQTTPSPTPTATPTMTPSPTLTPSTSSTPTSTLTPSMTTTPTITATSTASPDYSVTVTPTITLSGTITPIPSITRSSTPTSTITSTPMPNEIYKEENISIASNWQDGEYVWVPPGHHTSGHWSIVVDYNTDIHRKLWDLTMDDPVAIIQRVNPSGWGKVLSPLIQCNVDAYPYVEISVVGISPEPHATWKIGIQEMEGAERYWDLNTSSYDTGTFVFNYRDITGLSGEIDFVIQLTVEGAESRYIEVDYVRVFQDGIQYSPTPTWTPSLTPTPTKTLTPSPTPNPYDAYSEQFLGTPGVTVKDWEDEDDNAQFNAYIRHEVDGYYAKVTGTVVDGWGKVLSPHIVCNVDVYSMLEIEIAEVPWYATWKVGIQELEGEYRYWDVSNSRRSTGVYTINYAQLTQLSGVSDFAVQVTVEGGPWVPFVLVDFIRVYSENPPTWTPTATPTSSITPTATITPTSTPSGTITVSPTISATYTVSPTSTPTFTPTLTLTISPTYTPTPTATVTPTVTKTQTRTPVITMTYTPSMTATSTAAILSAGQELLAYPNPAKDIVKFAYKAAGTAKVSIDLYTLAGERVTSIDEYKSGGNGQTHVTPWDAMHVAPGIYIYRLVIQDDKGTRIKTGKVAVVR